MVVNMDEVGEKIDGQQEYLKKKKKTIRGDSMHVIHLFREHNRVGRDGPQIARLIIQHSCYKNK